jgi:class 3 adenylate cyclase
VLIGETTFRCLNDRFQVVGVGEVYLKGKAQGIAVYRVDRIDPNR